MNEVMFAWYLKERLLKTKQTPICAGDSLKKPTIEDKTKPLGFQKVGLENGQPKVTRLVRFIVQSRMGKC